MAGMLVEGGHLTALFVDEKGRAAHARPQQHRAAAVAVCTCWRVARYAGSCSDAVTPEHLVYADDAETMTWLYVWGISVSCYLISAVFPCVISRYRSRYRAALKLQRQDTGLLLKCSSEMMHFRQ